MGLDVYLCQFKDVDTDSILKLSHFADEPSESDDFEQWRLSNTRGSYPTEKALLEGRSKMRAKARELGLPEEVVLDGRFGGTEVSVPSQKHPGRNIGYWGTLDVVLGIMSHFLGKDAYFIFPEAKGDPLFFRPDWKAAKDRLSKVLEELRRLNQPQLESFLPSYWELFADDLTEIEIVIEAVEYVLHQNDNRQFLLYWSA